MAHFLKSLMIAIGCLFALMAASANAATVDQRNHWYFGLSGDLTWLEHSDLGGGGNVAIGYRFRPFDYGSWRVEAEGGFHSADGDGSFPDTRYFTYMGNLYWDFDTAFKASSTGWRIVPYIGAGLGGAAIRYGNSSFSDTFDDNENEFAYQGMAGLNFVNASAPNTDWFIGYRYLGSSGNDVAELESNNLQVGVRIAF